jgi:NhaP-type Na+/H+ and K+/H+ antiporter
VLAGSVLAALGAAKTRFPALVAFLVIGMLLGSDGPGGIAFDDAQLARDVGVVALAAILYEGGLSTSWRRLRPVAVPRCCRRRSASQSPQRSPAWQRACCSTSAAGR